MALLTTTPVAALAPKCDGGGAAQVGAGDRHAGAAGGRSRCSGLTAVTVGAGTL